MNTQNANRNGNTVAMVEKMAEEMGHAATAKLVFAEPVERDGISVIPVARIRYGFGGGNHPNSQGSGGSGAGGGMRAYPMGYIEVKNGGTSYHPILDPVTLARVALGALFVGMWAASKIIKTRSSR